MNEPPQKRLIDDLTIFSGVSGSGKTTAIRDLFANSHLANEEITLVKGAPLDWKLIKPVTEIVVLDELRTLRDVLGVADLLRRGHRVVAASHVCDRWWPFVAFNYAYRIVRLDQDAARLIPFLEMRGISYSEAALALFKRDYAISFTVLDMMLEYDRSDDLAHACERFARRARISSIQTLNYPTSVRRDVARRLSE